MSESKDRLQRLEAEHEALRQEIAQMTLFLSVNVNRHMHPKTYGSISRIVDAWNAAERA